MLFSTSDFTSIISHIHNWVLFFLWLLLFILSGVILHRSPVAYWAPTNLGSSSFTVLSFCLFILFMGFKARILKWFAIPFSSGPGFESLLHLNNKYCCKWYHLVCRLLPSSLNTIFSRFNYINIFYLIYSLFPVSEFLFLKKFICWKNFRLGEK